MVLTELFGASTQSPSALQHPAHLDGPHGCWQAKNGAHTNKTASSGTLMVMPLTAQLNIAPVA